MSCHAATLAQEARIASLEQASRARPLSHCESAELAELIDRQKHRRRNVRRKIKAGRTAVEAIARRVDRAEATIARARLQLAQLLQEIEG